ncbi:MAG: signal peptide peptidase SppA [Pirellulaceae bacterium]|nr:signal peptide peptidase SppA [Pirellulaceae bacterium]
MRYLSLSLMTCCLFSPVFASEGEKAKPTTESTATDASAEAQQTKSASVVSLALRGAMSETVASSGLFGELQSNLRATVDRLNRAATDEQVSAIILRIRNPTIGRGKLNELRQAIRQVRQSGKPVYASLESAQTADYLLACACDHIVMPESGMLLVPGVRAEITFYKKLLDKLGIRADMMQVGDFKGAAEPMTRDGMSESFRQQYDLLVDDLYDQLIDMIAIDRNFKREQVEQLVDQGLFTPAEALKAGLIDQVAYQDEYLQDLQDSLQVKELEIVKDYGRKKVDTDFSGMLGMVKFMEMMTGSTKSNRATKQPKIAVVYAVGAINSGGSQVDLLGGQTMGSDTIVAALQEAEEDDSVVSVVLRVDSPGGSAMASDLIWRKIQTMKKPVVASMGDTAASGGYYISMGCQQVFAEPGTLTGSIGVVGGKIATQNALGRLGVTTDVISRGKNSGIFAGSMPFSASERQAFQHMMEDTYRQFTAKAAAGRKMELGRLTSLAGGRVWTGRQAQAKGLVDQVGTLDDAIAAAKQLGGLAADAKSELLLLPKAKSFLEQLIQGPNASLAVTSRSVSGLSPEMVKLAGPFVSDFLRIQRLFEEPLLFWMPYRVDIR